MTQATRSVLAWLVKALAGLTRAGVVFALLTVLVFTVGQVVDRHFMKSGFSAFDQYARLGLVWMTFLGIAIAFRERANIRIDLADYFLPPKLTRVKAVVLDLAVIGVAVMLVVVGWRLLEVGSFQMIMDTPFSYEQVYGALLLGMALLACFVLVRLIDQATKSRFKLDAAHSTDQSRAGGSDPI